MRKSIISRLAEEKNTSVVKLLVDAFDKHGNMEDVARELGVDKSTVSVSIMRAGLKCKTIVVPKYKGIRLN
jgi:predicted transcriptional regulator